MRHRAPTDEEAAAPPAHLAPPEPKQIRPAIEVGADTDTATEMASYAGSLAGPSAAEPSAGLSPTDSGPPDRGNLIEVGQFDLDSIALDPPATAGLLLVPIFWQRFRFWAWHPVARSSLAVLVVAGLLPLMLSLTQHLTGNTDAAETTAPVPVITVPLTISVPVTVTSTPPPAAGTTAALAPVTVVRTTVLTTVRTTGAGDQSVVTTTTPLAPALLGPNVGTKAVICFTRATLELTATGRGAVELNVTGAASAHRSGRGSAKLIVAGDTGTYTVTYAAAGGNLAIRWSALQGACS